MHDTSLLYTCIIYAKMVQHVYTQTLEFTVFKTQFTNAKVTNYGQIMYRNYCRTI